MYDLVANRDRKGWMIIKARCEVDIRNLVLSLDDGITPEKLEKISAELVLTADDLELVLESQERVASGSD
jgi:hypothetical protein